MIWVAWNNGKHYSTGTGYGFKISLADRDRYFMNPSFLGSDRQGHGCEGIILGLR